MECFFRRIALFASRTPTHKRMSPISLNARTMGDIQALGCVNSITSRHRAFLRFSMTLSSIATGTRSYWLLDGFYVIIDEKLYFEVFSFQKRSHFFNPFNVSSQSEDF